MNLDDLEEAMEDIIPSGFRIDVDSRGQIIIKTNLCQDEDGELVSIVNDNEEEDDEEYDPDFEPLDEDLDDDE